MPVHPTAIVDPSARLHPSVQVGPFSIIDADVEIGEGTDIDAHVRIHARTTIGRRNRIFQGVILGGLPQHLTFDPNLPTRLNIGDDNVFREYVNIHRGSKLETPTTIGNRNYLMGNFHAGHDCVLGDDNIFTHGSMLAGHVIVGNRVFISGLVGLHQFTHVGDFAIIGGCSKVTEDVPPFSMVDGVPACVTGLNSVGMRRAGFSKDRFQAIKTAFRILYRSGHSPDAALRELEKRAEDPDIAAIVEFIRHSERGLMRYEAVAEGGFSRSDIVTAR